MNVERFVVEMRWRCVVLYWFVLGCCVGLLCSVALFYVDALCCIAFSASCFVVCNLLQSDVFVLCCIAV